MLNYTGTQNGATILEIKHRDSCTGPKPGPAQNHQELLTSDDTRVQSIQSRIQNTLPVPAQIPIIPGLNLQTLNYIVTITLGGRSSTVILDTGSDLTWLQCHPCRLCHSQPEPLYDPSNSPTYEPVPCSSQSCNSLLSATGSSGICPKNGGPTCNYAVTYGDGSYTRGDLAKDDLVLGSDKFPGFVFGCGRENKGLFGSASGLIGLGRSELSLVSQTYGEFGGIFSYCLPDSLNSGSLILGNGTPFYKNTTPISYAGLVQNNPRFGSFYALNLTGIRIGGVWIGLGDEVIVDSGTVVTRVKPSIYAGVRDEFVRQFSGYPRAPGFSILDTCFDLSGFEEVSVPSLEMWFEGGGWMGVDVSGMFYFVKGDRSQVCLAIASLAYESEVGIIGNYQQRNLRVLYDTKEMRLGFAKETCIFS
ncbi:eukaryotic aspartyl protease family protein [Striga asiatica]|uniref:Eukaryotic aspartyl protease family protein n=1 Tax=Striga asiatica TaxID=4170 RepID=A0A5A7RCP3_STRAF|nr:eukaryotic aspartyl protease family protein [Striga asiatica]